MPTKFTVKLREVGNTSVITIPKAAVRGLGWKENDELALLVDDCIIVRKETKGRKNISGFHGRTD